MNKEIKRFGISIFFACFFICISSGADIARNKIDFNFDWKFILDDKTEFATKDYNESEWRNIRLPHDWNVMMNFDSKTSGSAAYIPESVGWYRKHFNISAKDKGKKISVLFEGIFHKSDVYVNGKHLGFHPYGFGSIEYDLTPFLKYDGDNVIAVRADCTGERPRWYAGAGIYRKAWLQIINNIHITTYGTYVTTPVIDEKKAIIKIVTSIENSIDKDEKIDVIHTIVDPNGRKISAIKNKNINVASGKISDIKSDLIVVSPQLWDINSPSLYSLKTELRLKGKKIDEYLTTFGIRTMVFDNNNGFLLNGKRLKLQGVCLHQDAGCLGTAIPARADERKLEILKEYGCNAIRCSHNQPSTDFLNLCDSLGFIVIDEAFDKWKSGYYDAYFDKWWKTDLENMILRDRNHPSIALWSIGNELSEAWKDGTVGVDRAKMLQDYVHQLEPSRMVMLAAQNGHKDIFSGVTDVVGYNYLEERMLSDHKTYPERRFLISEELPYYRGAEGNLRSYGTDNPWNTIEKYDFIAGGFIWPGVDYWGEASWPSKGWPNGLFDICMFEKPRAAFHRSVWNKEPMVSIAVMDQSLDIDHGRDLWQWPRMASIWNFPSTYRGLVMEVRTVTNCEEVELYLNGKLMGRKKAVDFPNKTIVWNVPYQPGKLEAKGINKDEVECVNKIETSGNMNHIELTPDRDIINADGYDLSFITVELKDDKGVLAQCDNRELTVSVEGQGRLMGIDSGDLRRTEALSSNSIKSYFGKALIVVQSNREPGTLKVKVKVDGSDKIYSVEIKSVGRKK